jgi:predicted metal-dependent phosphoesterase TrpH
VTWAEQMVTKPQHGNGNGMAKDSHFLQKDELRHKRRIKEIKDKLGLIILKLALWGLLLLFKIYILSS